MDSTVQYYPVLHSQFLLQSFDCSHPHQSNRACVLTKAVSLLTRAVVREMATSAVRSEIWRPETPFFSALQSKWQFHGKQGFGLDSATERFDVGDEQHWAINVHPSNVFLFFYFLICGGAGAWRGKARLAHGVVRLLRCEINRINQMGWYSVRSTCSNKHHHHYQQQMRNSLNVKKCLFLYSLFG